jgi:ABC-type nickel/cobalt efflux system permease component RcnA
MLHGEALGLLVGAVALGAIHGIEPGHGWPVAASYALDQSNKWVYGFAAILIIGVGHLISSIAMVVAFFYAKDYFDLAQVNEPMTVLGNLTIGGPVSIVAGVLLIGLGVREYTRGHSHDHSNGGHASHEHAHDGRIARLKAWLPLVSGHSHQDLEDAADSGLLGIAWFAFVLGFAHE